jgi:putative lipoprotein
MDRAMSDNLVSRTVPPLFVAGAIIVLGACATSPRASRSPSPAASAAQTQRLEDADFRAVGNEPGWHMDIASGEKILLITDYGENRYELPFAKPDSSDGRSVYEITASGHHFTSVIEQKPCSDSMSGRAFVATVTVTIDGKEYTGCGGPPE